MNEFTGGSATYSILNENSSGQFETNQNYTGQISLYPRFDTANNIMSGTFEFQAQEIFSGEIITLTNGRFRLNIYKLKQL